MHDGEGRVAGLILQSNFSSLSNLGWATKDFSSEKDLKPGAQGSCWVPLSLQQGRTLGKPIQTFPL